ncbi:hypothetical protein CONPUDRAFT_162774 [Coniophora puteana RWD-64-598 SS2]|uniref:Transmembrane protein n=1 Tax=Coniophora puteana (strain RWD-64-598) TaxID=741705 RepID=A0A5M3N2U7_CONPW|nr:uncharacterized protein CONPUDRAFT_162774 [Coniophora puteana RWD-64-598 SS2]EIW85607.1 hypothetical protein CONPUDRAFT_162774 [Coniophora puteana RWD-64-598 SS2]
MPTITTILDDQAPLITYDRFWAPGAAWDDNLATAYYLGTFTTCNVTSGAASFTFNGTGFAIYGAERSNHGSYSVTVDGTLSTAGLNGGSSNAQFQQPLFTRTGLTQGNHTVSIENTASGSLYVDIDFIIWEADVPGEEGQELVPSVYQDTHPSFSYSAGQWSTNPPSVYLYNNGTGHTATTLDASVNFTFTGAHPCINGDVINLYGTVGNNNGWYTVQVDGGTSMQYNATRFQPYYQQPLFHANNLGGGTHQLTVTNQPQVQGQALNIDYAEVYSLGSGGSSPGSTSSSGGGGGSTGSNRNSPQTLSSSAKGISSGGIAGLAVLGATTLLALGAVYYLWRQWKLAEQRYTDLYRNYAQRPLDSLNPPYLSSGGVAVASGPQYSGSSRTLSRNNRSSHSHSWTRFNGGSEDGLTAESAGHVPRTAYMQNSSAGGVGETIEMQRQLRHGMAIPEDQEDTHLLFGQPYYDAAAVVAQRRPPDVPDDVRSQPTATRHSFAPTVSTDLPAYTR